MADNYNKNNKTIGEEQYDFEDDYYKEFKLL